MNVYETKQMYAIILYKIDVNYDIPLRNLLWRFSKKVIKWRRLLFVVLLTCLRRKTLFKWRVKKCKITNDICLELRLHSLYGCQGLLNSQLSKKAKRDTTQMAKMTRIAQLLPPINDWGFRKKVLCLQGSYVFINNFWTSSLWQIVYYTFFFKLKQFLPIGVICPTESVF